MTVNRVVFGSAILPTVLSILGFTHDATAGIFIFFFVFLAFGIGLVLGILISALAKKPAKEPWFYLVGQLIVIVPIVSWFFISTAVDRYKAREQHKYFGNIEANEDFVKYGVEDGYKDKVSIAIKCLSDKYRQNELQVRGQTTYVFDTVVGQSTEALFIVQLRYKLNSGTKLKASVSVFRDTAKLIYFGIPLDASEERRIDSLTKKAAKDLKDALEIAPDSIKAQMREDFKELLRD